MMTGLRAATALVIAGALILVSVAFPMSPARADSEIISTNPSSSATVSVVTRVGVVFAEPETPGDRRVSIEVRDDSARKFATSCAVVADGTATVNTVLGGSGRYTVTWRASSADGHTSSGDFQFFYEKPAEVAAVRGLSASICAARSELPAPSTPQATSSDHLADTDPTGVLIGGGVLVTFLVAAAVLVFALRPRRFP